MNQTGSTNINEEEMFAFLDRLMPLLPFGTEVSALEPDVFHPTELLIQLRWGSHVEVYAIDITTRTFIRVYV